MKHAELTEKIIGIFYDVYNELGVVEGKVLLELKSTRILEAAHEAQLLHYLKSTEIEVGLLLNFGSRPQFRRLLFDNSRKKFRGNPCESVAGVSA